MQRFLALALAFAATTALVAADFADARRMGGGRSLGAQRQSVTPAPSTPPSVAPGAPNGAATNPVMPAQPGSAVNRAAPGAAAAAPGAAAARSGASRWLGPIAGLAAGLGLAALAAHLGMSEALMSVLLVALVAVAAIALLRVLLARRGGPPARSAMAYAPSAGTAPRSPSVEPVFGGAARREPTLADVPGRYPPGFEPAPFLEQAKQQFMRLQSAYDRGDRTVLADVMTPEMFTEVAKELDTRAGHVATEIVALNPEIVEVTTEGREHWASVRFRGLLREDGSPMPKPFDEMWNLVKPVDDSSGWLLAGIRQLDEAPAGHA
jgi:predicted lipid-binding transport protein (Tim44 family)